MTNRNIIIALLVGTVVMFLILRWQGKSLEIAEHSPAGIVSLELSATPAVAGQVLNAWDGSNIQVARRNILLEFIFIFFYSWFYYTLCGNIAVRQDQAWSRVGVLLAIGSMVAALFNVFENILMLFTLRGAYSSFSLLATTTLHLKILSACTRNSLCDVWRMDIADVKIEKEQWNESIIFFSHVLFGHENFYTKVKEKKLFHNIAFIKSLTLLMYAGPLYLPPIVSHIISLCWFYRTCGRYRQRLSIIEIVDNGYGYWIVWGEHLCEIALILTPRLTLSGIQYPVSNLDYLRPLKPSTMQVWKDYREKNKDRFLSELLELLRIPC